MWDDQPSPGSWPSPPLTPFLVRLTTRLADEPWAVRLPATLATALSVVVIALVCRELGGGRSAQALAAWGCAFAALPLMLGHILRPVAVCRDPRGPWAALWPRFHRLD